MAHLQASVEVPAPGAEAWPRLTDPREQSSWMPATSVRVSRGSGRAAGDRIDSRSGWGPLGFTDVMVVTAYDPPRRWQVRHAGWLVRGAGVFEVEELGPRRCRVTWTEFLTPPLGVAGALALQALRPLLQAVLARSLRRFAAGIG